PSGESGALLSPLEEGRVLGPVDFLFALRRWMRGLPCQRRTGRLKARRILLDAAASNAGDDEMDDRERRFLHDPGSCYSDEPRGRASTRPRRPLDGTTAQ